MHYFCSIIALVDSRSVFFRDISTTLSISAILAAWTANDRDFATCVMALNILRLNCWGSWVVVSEEEIKIERMWRICRKNYGSRIITNEEEEESKREIWRLEGKIWRYKPTSPQISFDLALLEPFRPLPPEYGFSLWIKTGPPTRQK